MSRNKPAYVFSVDADTTEDDLKKQYKEFSLTAHPDTGGSDESFKQLQRTYKQYIKHLDAIKEFREMFAHSKQSLGKILGFASYVDGLSQSMSGIADIAIMMIMKKINSYDDSALLSMFIDYLDTLK